jgi:serine/threonine protein kinase
MVLPEDSNAGGSSHRLFSGGGSSLSSVNNNPKDPDGTATVIGGNAGQTPIHLPEDVCGLKLGHYELIRQLGIGGMAAVLLARDTQLDRLVALKVLPPENAKDRETLDRFHQEAKSGAKLDHENIARVYSSGQDQGLHFLALEYVEGETLKSLIDRLGKLSVQQALPYLHQAAKGLEHAASKGVVHRDIKPSNLLVTKEGKLKLVDLGLAKSLDSPAEEALTRYGATLGTFDYLAPEQALDPRKADSRSDIYSLGCTFYHMITGRSPVPDGTAAVKLAFHQQSKPVDPRRICPQIPAGVVALLDRMLEKKPENRFASPTELVHSVESVAKSLHVKLNQDLKRPADQVRLRQAGLIGLFLVFLFGALGIYLFDWGKAKTDRFSIIGASRSFKNNAAGSPTSKSMDENGPRAESSALFDTKDSSPLELSDWLVANAGKDRLEIVLHGDLDLSDLRERPDAGLVLSAKEILIRSAHPGRRATIRYQYDGRVLSGSWAMVALDAETVRLDGIRFLLDARESANEFRAVEARGGKLSALTVERCEFFQSGSVMDDRRRLSSLAICCQGIAPAVLVRDTVFLGFKESSPGDDIRPDIVKLFSGIYGGQDAILARGYYREIRCENCLFGPHRSCFRLEGRKAVTRIG